MRVAIIERELIGGVREHQGATLTAPNSPPLLPPFLKGGSLRRRWGDLHQRGYNMAEQHVAPGKAFALLVAVVYGSGSLQCLTVVSFPTSSTVLKDMYGFTDAQYGAIFLPQVALAVVGSIGGGMLARRLGLKTLLWLALLVSGVSQLLLASTMWL